MKTDTADDIKEFIISESKGEYFLISKEEIFQATSKSDNNGIRQITGYTEYRISSYDVNSGNLISRVLLGDRKENACELLGESNGLLWYKSVDPELGFHARDPKTLDVMIPQRRITNINPFLEGNLSQPEWNKIKTYYGFDIYKQMPMISDNSGFLYFIDPETLKAEKTGGSVKNYDFDKNCLSTSLSLNDNSNLYMKGSPRNHIEIGNKELEDVSFLKGEFIQSSVQIDPKTIINELLEPFNKEINNLEKQIDSLKNILSEFSVDSDKDKNKSITQSRKIFIERNIERLEKKIKYSEDSKQKETESENFTLFTPDGCVFVYSQTDVTDQSKVLISKIKIDPDTSIVLVWQTKLENIYSDPAKGLDRSAFEAVFSKGDPDLNTKRAVMGNGKLIFMSMLRAVCIDIENGKVLWEKEM
ncbi:MAG TPA: hypothetical protein PKD83_07315 [Ignavibacteria bacterium]|nr:hypothetical protein [Ignavibacteria bacterium]